MKQNQMIRHQRFFDEEKISKTQKCRTSKESELSVFVFSFTRNHRKLQQTRG
jgi:hypothetical protein